MTLVFNVIVAQHTVSACGAITVSIQPCLFVVVVVVVCLFVCSFVCLLLFYLNYTKPEPVSVNNTSTLSIFRAVWLIDKF